MDNYSKMASLYQDRIVDLDELTEGVPKYDEWNRIYTDVETTAGNEDAEIVELGFVILNKYMERITPFYQLVIEITPETEKRMFKWSRDMFTMNGLLVEGRRSKCTYENAFKFFMAAVEAFGGIFVGNAIMCDLKWLKIDHLPNPICDINVYRRSFHCAPIPRPRKHRVIDCLTFCITEELYYLAYIQSNWIEQNTERAKEVAEALLRHPIVKPNKNFEYVRSLLYEREAGENPDEEMAQMEAEMAEFEGIEVASAEKPSGNIEVSVVDMQKKKTITMTLPQMGNIPLMSFAPTKTETSEDYIGVIIHSVKNIM